MVKEKSFSMYKWEISNSAKFNQEKAFLICSVLKGSGEIITTEERSFSIEKGSHFILPPGLGNFELIVSQL